MGLYAISFGIDMQNPDQSKATKILCNLKQGNVCATSNQERNGRWEGWFDFVVKTDNTGFLAIPYFVLISIFVLIVTMFSSRDRNTFCQLYRKAGHPMPKDEL